MQYGQQGYGQQQGGYGQQQGGYGQQGFAPPPQQQQGTWYLFPRDGASGTLKNNYQVGPNMQQVLGRYDMVERLGQKQQVSRQQCAVQVDAQGTATVYSLGKPPTGFRTAPNMPWQWLYNGQSQVLTQGCKISLDYNDPEGAVYKCEMGGLQPTGGFGASEGGGFQQQGGYGQQQQGGFGQQQQGGNYY